MKQNQWTNNPIWNSLSEEKKEILEDFTQKTNGLTATQALPVLMQTQNKLKEKNIAFTQEETDLLITQLSQGLSSQEKATFETIRHMINL